jgi:trehalose-phosphatase
MTQPTPSGGLLVASGVRRALELAEPHIAGRPLLVISDFDGTLARIVDDPWGATILPLGRRALRSLAGMPQVHVAILSGRTAHDAAARVRVGGVTYLGNHGMERAFLGRGGRPERLSTQADDAAHEAVAAAEHLSNGVPGLIREPWLVVERKPPAVAFHFRTAPDLAQASASLRNAVDQLDPDGILERFPGRRMLELRPFGAVAKGEALAALVERLAPHAVFMLGDDVSDALAFRALRDLRQRGVTDGMCVAVKARPDIPAEVLESADVILSSPTEATRFLSALARRLVGGLRARTP